MSRVSEDGGKSERSNLKPWLSSSGLQNITFHQSRVMRTKLFRTEVHLLLKTKKRIVQVSRVPMTEPPNGSTPVTENNEGLSIVSKESAEKQHLDVDPRSDVSA